VRHLILELIPMLAAFNIAWFGSGRFELDALSSQDQNKTFQDVCISHILQRIGTGVGSGGGGGSGGSSSSSGNSSGNNDPGSVALLAHLQGNYSDRPPAYRALGELATATGSKILHNAAILNETLEAIQSGFRSAVFCSEAVACLRLVVSAQTPTKQMEQAFTNPGHMVRDIFRGGVNQDLVRRRKQK